MTREIHTGGDPRNFLEFSEIRHEINKMGHPAVDRIDYELIEANALIMFEQNGVDLQTAAYFTFARTKLYDLRGFLEGIELISVLIVNSWDNMWPESESARIDMLDWLNNRIGQDIRQISFKTNQIPQLLEIEQPLAAIALTLHRLSLKRNTKLVDLLSYIINTRESLEKRIVDQQKQYKKAKEEVLIYRPDVITVKPSPAPAQQSIRPQQPSVSVQTQPVQGKRSNKIWLGFVLGVFVTALSLIGLDYYRYQRYSQVPVHAPLSFFTPLSESEIQRVSAQLPSSEALFYASQFSDYQTQIAQLMTLSPLATRYYGDNLLAISRTLWPNLPERQQLDQAWRNHLKTQYSDRFIRDSYAHAQRQLQQLSDELNLAEQQKRSITISYLKSSIYDIQTNLNKETPLEELLHQLSLAKEPSPALIRTINERFNSLLSYYQLTLKPKGSSSE